MTNRLRNSRNSNSSSDPREELLQILRCLPFEAYILALYLFLLRLGYQRVTALGRNHLRGRKADGGADFEVAIVTPTGQLPMLVQVKQEDRPLQRRYVDELRGRLIRSGTYQGLIVTTSPASRAAIEAARLVCPFPVNLIDGNDLAGRMFYHGFGVQTTCNKVKVDRAFFRSLVLIQFAANKNHKKRPGK